MSEALRSPEDAAFLDLNTLLSGRDTVISFEREFPFLYEAGTVSSEGTARVHGTLSDYSGVLQFKACFTFGYRTVCDRCLKPIARTLVFEVDKPVSKEPDEDGETVLCANDRIDLSDLCFLGVTEQLPFKHLCSENCKGLCPYCGTDLNEAACDCKAPPDPRLAGLQEFFHE